MEELTPKEKLKAYENTLKIENALKKMNDTASGSLTSDPTIYINDEGEEFKTTERIIKSVTPPISYIPTDDELFSNIDGKPNYIYLRNHFKREGKLSKNQVLKIIKMATAFFSNEPNLLNIKSPVTICGDIHGQFYDLCKLFQICGDPDKTNFLFLGDYVDRGAYSLEVLLLLYSMKINHPNTFFMLRGNHESLQMTQHFTFKSECLVKYSIEVYHLSLKSFSSLPIAGLMNNQFFCVHGGISKDIKYINDINKIDRFQFDFPTSGSYCDIMWSDPSNDYDEENFDKNLKKSKKFSKNFERGCSYFYNYNAICEFLERNNLLSVIRAHQAQDQGYRMYKKTPHQNFPSLITLFSAPNYCGTYGNKAAVLKYDTTTMNIRQFSAEPEPYHLPGSINVFTWSIPFVAERVCEILFSILNVCTDEELNMETPLSKELADSLNKIQNKNKNKIKTDESGIANANANEIETENGTNETDQTDNNIEPKTLDNIALRNKILAIGRLSRMFQLLRQESEKVEQLRSLSGGLKLPKGVLLNGSEELDKQLSHFERVRLADISNEAVPTSVQDKDEDDKYKKLLLEMRRSR